MIFDTHAHYDDKQFDEDRAELLNSMQAAGVGTIVNASATVASWDAVRQLTEQYPFVYGMIGVHPDEVGKLDEESFGRMEELLQGEKLVAVGEIGLDYYWDKEKHELQQYWFRRQLDLAEKLSLPVSIHSRDAAEDTMAILKEYAGRVKAVLHCYSYSPEMAKEFLRVGYWIGVGGVVSFKNGRRLTETVKETPMERILLETDCPYLSPEPFRGRRNSSLMLSYVAKAIAQLKGITEDEVIQITEKNGREFFFSGGTTKA